MISYKENLINENSQLSLLDPISRLMAYRMLPIEEMKDRDCCGLSFQVYEKLEWLRADDEKLEPDTFFGSPYFHITKMCRRYDSEKQEDYYVKDFKRFVVSEKNENYDTMKDARAQFLRKEWFCLRSTKEHYRNIFNNADVIHYVDSAHKIGAFHIIPKGFGYMPKCKWLLDDGIRSLMVIEDNWEYLKKLYGDISFEEYRSKFCLQNAYCNGKLRKELMIDFNMTWDELFLTLRNLAELIDRRTALIILKLAEREKGQKI